MMEAMARRRKQQTIEITPFVILLIIGLGFGIYQSQESVILITSLSLLVLVVIGLSIFLVKMLHKERWKRSGIEDIDNMSGIGFEKYLQVLLSSSGFTHVKLTSYYDLGVDLVARKDGITWAIQAKKYKGVVGLDAVRQVVAAKGHYKCDRAMVITNSYFTKNAKTIAESTDCVLVDRDALIRLILAQTPTAESK